MNGAPTDINEQTGSEEALQKSIEKYRSLVNNIPGMVYQTRSDWSVEIISNSINVCGYPVEEFTSKKLNWVDLIHPADQQKIVQEGHRLSEEPCSIVQEYRVIAKDGSIHWVSDHKSSFFTKEGKFERIDGVVYDITERKRSEDHLRESENKFRALFEQAAIGFAQIETKTGHFVRVNQRYCDIVGYSIEELTKLKFQDITYPDDLPTNLEKLNLLLEGVIREFVLEKRYYRKDKSVVWVNLTVSAMWAPGEEPNYHIAVVEDTTQRKLAEEEYRKFSRAVEQSNSSVMITDTNGIIEYVNPTFTRLSGFTALEAIGKKPSISKSGKTSGEEYQHLWQVIASGGEWQGEFHNRRKDGSFYWVSASISPIRNSEGVITHFLAIQEDITEQKRIQETLSRQNDYLSALHEITLGMISHLDLDKLLQTLIARAGRLLNTPHGYIYLVDKEKNELECKFAGGEFKKFLGLRLKPGEGVAGKVWQTCRTIVIDDYQTWEGRSPQVPIDSIRSSIGIPLMSDSQVTGVFSFAYDFNSKEVFGDNEVELLERLARLVSISIENARLFNETQRLFKTEQQRAAELAIIISVSDAIAKNLDVKTLSRIVGDKITKIFSADAAAILLLDTQTNQIHPLYEFDDGQYVEDVQPFPLGKGLTSWIIQARQPLLLGTADEAAEYGVYYPPEAQAIKPTYTQSYLGVPILVGTRILGVLAVHSYSPHVFDQNSTRLLTTIATSVGVAIENAQLFAEAQKARQAAESANASKSAFLANISHELRTPLNAILGFAQLLRQDRNLTLEQKEYLEIINQSGLNLVTLINDVLEISKIESGRATIRANSFDLFQMLDSTEEMFFLRAKQKGLTLSFERGQEVPRYIRTDEVKLRHTLHNLLGNAIKFTQKGSVSMRIGILPQPGEKTVLHFEVEDTGPGIAPEELAMIFEPFVQASIGQQSQEGTGLGLFISRQYIHLMGGEISVSSILGEGSLFQFDVPVQKASIQDIQLSPSSGQVIGLEADPRILYGGHFRLLIVDDDQANRKLLVKLMEPLGFELREAVNGQEAVEIWEHWDPDLIWMDMHMPVMDGYQATRQIKSSLRGQSTVIIALTAASFEEDREKVLLEGCDDFIRKPFKVDEIYNLLTKHLGVRFLYEKQPQSDLVGGSEASSPSKTSLGSLDLSGLPENILGDLREATVSANFNQILSLIDQIQPYNQPLADTLAKLAGNFEYRKILTLVDEAGDK